MNFLLGNNVAILLSDDDFPYTFFLILRDFIIPFNQRKYTNKRLSKNYSYLSKNSNDEWCMIGYPALRSCSNRPLSCYLFSGTWVHLTMNEVKTKKDLWISCRQTLNWEDLQYRIKINMKGLPESFTELRQLKLSHEVDFWSALMRRLA